MTNLQKIKPLKKIKVGLTYTTPTKYKNTSYPVPSIRISGKYLESHGFNINDIFELLSTEHGTIVLRKIHPLKITLKELLKQKFLIDDNEADVLIRYINSQIYLGIHSSKILQEDFNLSVEQIENLVDN